jgi:pimeloyl-ACP methyl ester carboxylesterase
VSLNRSIIYSLNTKTLILFLHGFSSCKEDLVDIILNPALQKYRYLVFNAPGCGHSDSNNISATDIPFLIVTAFAMLEHFKITKSNLIGYSMGGLTALLLACQCPNCILSFVNIKGNLMPEDCFLSWQIFNFPSDDPEAFLNEFIVRTQEIKSFACPLYASTLHVCVQAGAVCLIFESMVQLLDNKDLLGIFLNLPCPKMFMYGEENQGLSYLL